MTLLITPYSIRRAEREPMPPRVVPISELISERMDLKAERFSGGFFCSDSALTLSPSDAAILRAVQQRVLAVTHESPHRILPRIFPQAALTHGDGAVLVSFSINPHPISDNHEYG